MTYELAFLTLLYNLYIKNDIYCTCYRLNFGQSFYPNLLSGRVKYRKLTCWRSVEMASSCCSVDSRTLQIDYPCSICVYCRWKAVPGHCTSPARRRRCTNTTLALWSPKQLADSLWAPLPWGKRPPTPAAAYSVVVFFSSSSPSLSLYPFLTPPFPKPFYPLKSEVSKNIASYSARYNSEGEEEKALPSNWADWRRLRSL